MEYLLWLGIPVACGVLVALLLKRRLWLVVPLSFAPVPLAIVYVATSEPTGSDVEGAAMVAGLVFVIGGWIVGLLLASTYVLVRRRA